MLRRKTYVHMRWRARARTGKFRAKQTQETQKQRNAKQREKAQRNLQCNVTVV